MNTFVVDKIITEHHCHGISMIQTFKHKNKHLLYYNGNSNTVSDNCAVNQREDEFPASECECVVS